MIINHLRKMMRSGTPTLTQKIHPLAFFVLARSARTTYKKAISALERARLR
jgi:hypothetical protein